MRIYVGFDDTDTLEADRGTGKLARWFERVLPAGCSLWGVVRQQLLVHPAIPYTSRNSSACAVIEADGPQVLEPLVRAAVEHLEAHAVPGSDPGLCVASEGNPALEALRAFGWRAATELVTQAEALQAAEGAHLSGHGGTRDGIIGAAAGVGLTWAGWSGRLIEHRSRLRSFAGTVPVGELEGTGITVVSVGRDAPPPAPGDRVDTQGWLRPRLWAGTAVLPVESRGPGLWRSLGSERRKGADASGAPGAKEGRMAGKIFYRERTKVGEKEKKPRFKLVAVADVDLKIFAEHVRKSDLEAMAQAVGAELVLLPSGPHHRGDEADEVEVKV